MNTTNREVERLNKHLKRELGEAPNGDARFKWIYSEDLIRDMVTGEFDYVCGCGVNVRVHSALCSGVVAPRVQTKKRKLYFDLNRQWVLCYWKPPPDRATWERAFGNTVTYPSRGSYWAVHYNGPVEAGTFKKYISMKPECLPTMKITDAFIGAYRKSLEKSQREQDAEALEAMQREERRVREERREAILDIMGPFPQGITGKRGHGVSLPDPKQQAEGDAAPAWTN